MPPPPPFVEDEDVFQKPLPRLSLLQTLVELSLLVV